LPRKKYIIQEPKELWRKQSFRGQFWYQSPWNARIKKSFKDDDALEEQLISPARQFIPLQMKIRQSIAR
jgi:hypothetical protein